MKDIFPLNLCEGTQQGNLCEGTQQGISDKFDGDQLCYGLSDLDLMVVDVCLNLCGGNH